MIRKKPLAYALILLVAIGCQQEPASANPILAAKTAVNIAIGVYKSVKAIQRYFAAPPTEDESMTKLDAKLFENLNSISGGMQNLKDDLFDKISMDLQNKLTTKSNVLFEHINNVRGTYEKFLTYNKNPKNFQESTLLDFSDTVTTSRLHQFPATLVKMHEALSEVDINNESILSILANRTNSELMCIRNQPPQQVIHDLYKTVIMADIQGLVMKLFAYDIKESVENAKAKYQSERDLAIQEFTERISATYSKVKDAMTSASRELWKCDPARHQKDITYSKIQEVFQAVINFEADTRENTCTGTCSAIEYGFQRCRSGFCQSQPKQCNGHLRNCQSIHKDYTFCNAPKESDRRYQWMKTASGTKYGKVGVCNATNNVVAEAAGAFICEYCMCTCVSDENLSDRYFSLSEATADILDNKVVTGVRFKKINHVFYIQVQQGYLGTNGSIDPSTVEWKKIEREFTDVRKFSEEIRYPPTSSDEESYVKYVVFKRNPNVYTVKWNQKTVYLDDIEPKLQEPMKNHVVTGLRFRQVGKDLRLEVEMSKFNYSTGKLTGRNKWYFNKKSRRGRSPLVLNDADTPINARHNIADSHANQYVEFQLTDLHKDLGQYTIPFIDIQEIASTPPVPLAGAGIFHKGTKGSGGFLSLKLIHYDFTKHL